MLWPLSVVLVANTNGRLAIPALAGLTFSRYLTLKNIVNLTSRLGVTRHAIYARSVHRRNLQTRPYLFAADSRMDKLTTVTVQLTRVYQSVRCPKPNSDVHSCMPKLCFRSSPISTHRRKKFIYVYVYKHAALIRPMQPISWDWQRYGDNNRCTAPHCKRRPVPDWGVLPRV